jgi:REP element-mobilizing transposase RayT
MSMAEGLNSYRRRLPHWRFDESTYYVTWHLAKGQPSLSAVERCIVQSALLFFQGQRYQLRAYVVMDDHVHLLVTPFKEYALDRLLHSWKSFTAHELVKKHGRRAPVWLAENFDRIIRDEDEFMQKAEYIVSNPQRRWPDIRNYRWAEYIGFKDKER